MHTHTHTHTLTNAHAHTHAHTHTHARTHPHTLIPFEDHEQTAPKVDVAHYDNGQYPLSAQSVHGAVLKFKASEKGRAVTHTQRPAEGAHPSRTPTGCWRSRCRNWCQNTARCSAQTPTCTSHAEKRSRR